MLWAFLPSVLAACCCCVSLTVPSCHLGSPSEFTFQWLRRTPLPPLHGTRPPASAQHLLPGLGLQALVLLAGCSSLIACPSCFPEAGPRGPECHLRAWPWEQLVGHLQVRNLRAPSSCLILWLEPLARGVHIPQV